MSFNKWKQDRFLIIIAIAVVFGSVIIIGTILFLKSKEETIKYKIESQVHQEIPNVAKESDEEGYYNRIVENPEPPEYKSASWGIPHAGQVLISSFYWPETYNPTMQGLPDSIWWNFFKPNDKRAISRQEKEILQQHGFFLEETRPLEYIRYDDMIDSYSDLYTEGYGQNFSTVPVFISSDFLLHVYHVVFDRMLQDVEEKKLYFRLLELTKEMVEGHKKELDNVQNEKLHEAALRNYAFFSVAQKLLDTALNVDLRVEPLVSEELHSIKSANEAKTSTILHQDQDYTQFKPRGHYTKSPRLGRYFRAMMWYGRSPFSLKDSVSTQSALMIAKVWLTPQIKRMWHDLADPISMLTGQPDDFAPPDCEELVQQIYNDDLSEKNLLDYGKLNQFMEQAIRNSKARIVDKAMRNKPHPKRIEYQFRFIGQRFIPDSYIFTQLTSPRVGTDKQPRNIPKPADVMTVLGSPFAEKLVTEDYNIPGYKENMDSLKQEFGNYSQKVWAQSMYWSWLNSLRALLVKKDNHYPFFMRTEHWAVKSLLTSLASWSELRHDMILYSKQSAAECGEGDEEIPPKPPQPKGYVEADLEFFNRFVFLVQQAALTLSENHLLSDEYLRKNSLFLDHVLKLREITRKELLNQTINKDEYEFIMKFSSYIAGIVIPEGVGDVIENKFKQMAMIADVHTDFFEHQVLEVGIGIPQRIYVAVNDKSGGSRICVGYVLSYYEFTQPMDQRLNDDEWKANFYPSKSSSVDIKEPKWIKDLRVK